MCVLKSHVAAYLPGSTIDVPSWPCRKANKIFMKADGNNQKNQQENK